MNWLFYHHEIMYLSEDKLWIPKNLVDLVVTLSATCQNTKEVVFEECEINQVNCINQVIITAEAFQKTGIEAIYIPYLRAQVTLGDDCFRDCSNLKEVNMNASCIPNDCFHGCKLLSHISSMHPTSLGHHAFFQTDIRSITIPKEVETIPPRCFQNCRSLSIVLFEDDSKLKEIEYEAFQYTIINKITIPKEVETIRARAFMCCCQLSKLEFAPGSELKRIEEYAFSNSNIERVMLPPRVVLLGQSCFSHWSPNWHSKLRTNVVIEEGSEYAKILETSWLGNDDGFVIKYLI
jgi:hypothetical protein